MSKIKFVMLFMILSACKIITAQNYNSWSRIADFGGVKRNGAIAFSIGNKGYVGLGYYVADTFPYPHSYLTDFWEYDPATNIWIQKANFPSPGRRFPAYFVINSKAYVGMGYAGDLGSERLDFWQYDPATDTWTQKANFAGAARQEITGFSIGSKGYAGLGNLDSAPSGGASDFWEYDPAIDTWTRKADCPNSYELFGLTIGDKGYAGFGTAPLTVTHIRDFWQYDPITDTWAQKADYAGKSSSGSFCFSIGQYGYVGTGYQDTTGYDTNDFWQYNPATNSWVQKDSFGGGIRELGTAFSIGNYGYGGTGSDGTHACTTDFWRYTPDSIETAIKEINPATIILSPNPTTDKLYISSLPQTATLTITDITGRLCSVPISGREIDVSPLPSGIYLLHIQDSSGSVVKKFVKE